MSKVVSVRGYTVMVFTGTCGSPHVNVLKEGILLTIMLESLTFACAKYGRPSEHVKHEAIAIVEENLEACWKTWRRIYV